MIYNLSVEERIRADANGISVLDRELAKTGVNVVINVGSWSTVRPKSTLASCEKYWLEFTLLP